MVGAILLKATVVAGVALAANALLSRSRASVRHTLLAAAFAVLVVIPLAQVAGPQWRLALRMPAPAAPKAAGTISVARITAVEPVAEAAPRAAAIPWSLWLIAAWLAGVLLTLVPVIIGVLRIRALRRSAIPWTQTLAVATERVALLVHEAVPGPMTCGVFRPSILLPDDAAEWSQEDVQRALIHELEHVRRLDWIVSLGARVASSMYWFHPLVWMMWNKLSLEAERACDDAVLAQSEPTAYADQLLALARRAKAAKSPLLAMASRADLGARIDAVLDGQRQRGRAGKQAMLVAGSAALALLLIVAPLRVVAAPQDPGGAEAAVPKFVDTTRLVIVDVSVTYSNGQPVEGLRPSDFTVFEDGRQQYISVFELAKPDSLPSYYIVGYYSRNSAADGAYRKIEITESAVPSAKLDYRAGYYAERGRFVPAPAAGQTNRKIDSNNQPPIPRLRPQAQYSEEARKVKWGGTVLLNAEVTASGDVTEVTVAKPLGLGLDQKAVDAVTKWKFIPATKDGKPVSASIQVEVAFHLL